MPTLNGRTYQLNELHQLWASIYHNRQTQLGATATLVNFGDQPNAGFVNATTFTGMMYSATGLAPVWTPNVALNARAVPFDLTLASNWQGIIPILDHNGTSERMTTPDAAYWSRALTAASWGAWVRITGATIDTIMAKFTTAGDLREWRFWITSANKLQLILSDENDAGTPNATLDTLQDGTIATSTWNHVVATYDGTANASGIDLYVNGALIASTDTDDVNFVSMRDTTSVVELGTNNAGDYFVGRMAGGPCGPFFVQAQLTVAQILNMYRLERLALGV